MPDPVSYTATLPNGESTVAFVSGLLNTHRTTTAPDPPRPARVGVVAPCGVGVCAGSSTPPGLPSSPRKIRSAARRRIGTARGHRRARHRRAGSARRAALAARSAGHSHVTIDGTLIRTDRSRAVGPTAKVDLCWSGKHHHHGGNVQLVTAPDGWPLWTSPVRPGHEHDVTCARAYPGLLDRLSPPARRQPAR